MPPIAGPQIAFRNTRIPVTQAVKRRALPPRRGKHFVISLRLVSSVKRRTEGAAFSVPNTRQSVPLEHF